MTLKMTLPPVRVPLVTEADRLTTLPENRRRIHVDVAGNHGHKSSHIKHNYCLYQS